MKKLLAMLLSLAMVFALVSCGSAPSSTSGGNASNSAAQSDGSADASGSQGTDTSAETGDSSVAGHKIGMIWYGNTDAMGSTFYAWANHAELLGVELVWALGSYTTADELTDCENLISAGCEGIYFIPMDTAANPAGQRLPERRRVLGHQQPGHYRRGCAGCLRGQPLLCQPHL